MVVFHAQQALEKCFKAVLEEKESFVPKLHDRIPLRNAISQFIEIKVSEKNFSQINELYIDARYPSELGLLPEGKPDETQAAEYSRIAREISAKVSDYLKDG